MITNVILNTKFNFIVNIDNSVLGWLQQNPKFILIMKKTQPVYLPRWQDKLAQSLRLDRRFLRVRIPPGAPNSYGMIRTERNYASNVASLSDWRFESSHAGQNLSRRCGNRYPYLTVNQAPLALVVRIHPAGPLLCPRRVHGGPATPIGVANLESGFDTGADTIQLGWRCNW